MSFIGQINWIAVVFIIATIIGQVSEFYGNDAGDGIATGGVIFVIGTIAVLVTTRLMRSRA